jgi:hypothetical protein
MDKNLTNVNVSQSDEIDPKNNLLANLADTEEDQNLEDQEDDQVLEDGEGKQRKRGKRQIIYYCAGYVTLLADISARNLKAGDKAVILEAIPVTMPAEDADFDPAQR